MNIDLSYLNLSELAQLFKFLWFCDNSYEYDFNRIINEMINNSGEADTRTELSKVGFTEDTIEIIFEEL